MQDEPRRNFSRHPLLWLAICFAAGILGAKFVAVPLTFGIGAALALSVAAVLFRSHCIASILVFAAFAAAGAASYSAEIGSIREDRLKVLLANGTLESGTTAEIEGVLTRSPEPAFDGYFLNVDADRLVYRGQERAVSGRVRVFFPGEDRGHLGYGSRVRVACALMREERFLNPGVVPATRLLDQIGVDATCSVKSRLLIEHIAHESVFIPMAMIYEQRLRLIEEFRSNLSPRAAGVMIASLLGNKHFLDKETADLFRDGGTFHVLVISGLHITFIGGVLLILVRSVTRQRWLQFIVTVSALWAYTLAVGAEMPVVRASIMFTVMMLGYALYRRGELLNTFGLSALILLVMQPSALFEASLQLTLVSVFAIVGCAVPLLERLQAIGRWAPSAATPFPPNVPAWLRNFCEWLYWDSERWAVEAQRNTWTANFRKVRSADNLVGRSIRAAARWAFNALVVSLIVQIWMLPLSIIYFNRVSVASVVLNLWVGLFIALESFAAVLGLIGGAIVPLLGDGFYVMASALNWLLLALPSIFSEGGWASYRLPAYTGAAGVAYAVYFVPMLSLAALVIRWDPSAIGKRPRMLTKRPLIFVTSLAICLILIVTLHPFSAPRATGKLSVEFIDVGQGDSALVTFPDGRLMLIDAGGRLRYRSGEDEEDTFEPDLRDIGESVVSQFLWSRGYSQIDAVFVSHADADHVGGMIDVAKNFRIGTAFIGRMPPGDPEMAELAAVLDRRGIPVEPVRRGDHIDVNGVRIEVLHPPQDGPAASPNDDSLVLRIVFGDTSFLLTGDIERAGEATLLASGAPIAADVVKVPHHGSRTSSSPDLIITVNARYAVIPVGRRSPFGHPHEEVVTRWRNAGVELLVTGADGLVSFTTDGNEIEVRTFVPQPAARFPVY